MYLDQGKQDVALLNVDQELKYNGILLHRFKPPTDLLTLITVNKEMGSGFPVDGVHPASFTTDFHAYVPCPLFLYGDASLQDPISVTLEDGKTLAKHTDMYESANKMLKHEFANKYMTFLDIEAGTDKTMRARKRLMAFYAFSKSSLNGSAVMTDVLWPNLPTDVIVSSYWGEESATIGKKQIDKYMSIKSLLRSLPPKPDIEAVLRLALAIRGFVCRRSSAREFTLRRLDAA